MGHAMQDRLNGKKTVKHKPIEYKEQRPQAWSGNSVIEDYWKRKDEEHRAMKEGEKRA
jgi:hypothetical protein